MHDPAENWTRVTASTHPQIHAAFNVISGTQLVAYNVPSEYAYGLSQTEVVLDRLNADDRTKLCHGDYELDGSTDVITASDVLSAFAYGWPALRVRKRRTR
jgi:hypothetical protein